MEEHHCNGTSTILCHVDAPSTTKTPDTLEDAKLSTGLTCISISKAEKASKTEAAKTEAAKAESSKIKTSKIEVSKAEKALSDLVLPKLPTRIVGSLYSFRADLSKSDQDALTLQLEMYPIWYFLYGTIAEPEVLSSILLRKPKNLVEYRPARVYGAKHSVGDGKYKALKNGGQSDAMVGWAFRATHQDDAEALQHHQKRKYEVVQCVMELLGGWETTGILVKGLTFRFDPTAEE